MFCIYETYKGAQKCGFLCIIYIWNIVVLNCSLHASVCVRSYGWSLLVAMGVSSVSPSSGGLQFPIRFIDTPAVLRIHSSLSLQAQCGSSGPSVHGRKQTWFWEMKINIFRVAWYLCSHIFYMFDWISIWIDIKLICFIVTESEPPLSHTVCQMFHDAAAEPDRWWSNAKCNKWIHIQ